MWRCKTVVGIDRGWLFIENVSGRQCLLGLWCDGSDSEPELQFRFSSTIELLVDRRVIAIERDIGGSGIREAFEDNLRIRRNSKEESKLESTLVYFESLGMGRQARAKGSACRREADRDDIQTYLGWQYVSSQIPQGKLESSIIAIDDNLQCYQGILIDRCRYMRLIWASHGRRSG